MRKAALALACSATFAVALAAQGMGMGQGQAMGQGMNRGAAPASLVAEVEAQYTQVTNNVIGSIDAFPEDKYTWSPPIPAQPDNATIRSWAQLVAHMTDDANGNCWQMAGLSSAPARVENGQPAPNSRTKADLNAGYKAAVEVCKKAFASVTPANMTEPSGGRGNSSKLGQLVTITAHTNEHYGNMVTYMRIAGVVPYSTASRGARRGGGMGGGQRGGGMGGAQRSGGMGQ
jgi:uncharacterized damage-inducible protein DinB